MSKRDSVVSKLKSTLIAEKAAVKKKLSSLDDKIAKADKVFPDNGVTVDSKPEKIKKETVKRDSFTFPLSDYDLIKKLQNRSLSLGINTNKSEILRAALHHIDVASDEVFLSRVKGIEKIKVGRKG